MSGKVTDCVMECVNLWKEVYTGKTINTQMIVDDVFAVCRERDDLLRRVAELEAWRKTANRAGHLAAAFEVIEGLKAERDSSRARVAELEMENQDLRKELEERDIADNPDLPAQVQSVLNRYGLD